MWLSDLEYMIGYQRIWKLASVQNYKIIML